jgi:hypothetical protein
MKMLSFAALFVSLSLPLSAQQAAAPTSTGGPAGPWALGAISMGLGEDAASLKAGAAKGLAIKVGEEGEAAVAYDLELCRLVRAWKGKFVTQVKSPAGGESLAPAGSVTFSTGNVAGLLIGPASRLAGDAPDKTPAVNWRDPRSQPTGPLPAGQAQSKGFYVNGDKVILKWEIGGMTVLELPAYDVVLNGGGHFTRTFHVPAGAQAIQILVAADPEPNGPFNVPTHLKTEGEAAGLEDKERIMQSTPWVHGEHGDVMVWAAGDPDGSKWRMVNGQLALEVAPRMKATTFQIAYWPAPKSDPDGRTAPLFFREPVIDLPALIRDATFHAPD